MTGDYSATSQEGWGDAAEAWARAAAEPETGASAIATAWMLEAAQLEPGQQILELACGAGRVGLHAAEQVAPGGRAVLSDFAEPMVKAVEAGVERLGLDNVEARVLDAEHADLDGEHFDVVLCRFGFMLMNDPLAAMKISAGALAPHGRLVLVVWGAAEKNPWLMTILQTIMAHFDAPPPEPGTPGPFALGDPDRLRSLLEEAGFSRIEIEELEGEQAYDSPQGWWEEILAVSGPLAAVFKALPEADVEAIKARALADAPMNVRDDGSVAFPAAMLAASATPL